MSDDCARRLARRLDNRRRIEQLLCDLRGEPEALDLVRQMLPLALDVGLTVDEVATLANVPAEDLRGD